jgi:probable phosphoglycerate mutase
MESRQSGCELLLIRHAQSEWNVSGRWQGHADPPLTELGRAQAEALAGNLVGVLGDVRPGLLLCSDLQRAWQTAAAVGRRLGLEPRPEPRLRELDIGHWSGLTREELLAREPESLARFESGDPDFRPGGGETRREIRLRARRVVSDWVEAHPAELIAVVTHLGFLRALLPGEEPGNADWIRVDASEALTRRARLATDPDPSLRTPL